MAKTGEVGTQCRVTKDYSKLRRFPDKGDRR